MRKILVSAYGCEPGKGSEQGVGWHWVLEMAKSNELWVITRSNNQPGIENSFPQELERRVHFIYYDLPKRWKRFKKKEKGLYFYYSLWQWGAYKIANELCSKNKFDYCQHLTFGSMWMPTFMHRLPIPFIWGPVGGGESIPDLYIKTLPWRGRILENARNMLTRFTAINPLFMGPTRKSCAIIARTESSRDVFPKLFQKKVSVMLETGMSDAQLQEYQLPNYEARGSVVKFIYTGRLVPSKNVALAIHAVSNACRQNNNIHLTVVGEGPLKNPLMKLVRDLKLLENVTFTGAVSHEGVIQRLQESDVYLFPSLKEGGAWSLMEAMAVGLPIICMNTTGMKIITDDTCAIRLKPTMERELITSMTKAICLLTGSASKRKEMGENGRRRIESSFSWSQKGRFMEDLLKKLDDSSSLRSLK